MEITEVLPRSQLLVKELAEGLNAGDCDLEGMEKRILSFVHELAYALERQVLQGIEEPTQKNSLRVGERTALCAGKRNRRFRTRFGGTLVIARRCYKYREGGGGFSPLDEKLGLDRCLGYSPLMSYLLTNFRASEPFARASELLSEALGFSVSPTAVQRNTEAVGERVSDNPYALIDAKRGQQACEVMVVQVDGTISPQILEKEGLRGRESLKQPTDWKECNVVVVQKLSKGKEVDRWTGALYGKHALFETYAGRAAIAMGQHVAKRVVFLADGAHTNWELQKTNFPGSVAILDFYHASEHLGTFAALLKDQKKASAAHHRWAHMLRHGHALQVVQELRRWAERVADRDAAIREINYFDQTPKGGSQPLVWPERQLPVPVIEIAPATSPASPGAWQRAQMHFAYRSLFCLSSRSTLVPIGRFQAISAFLRGFYRRGHFYRAEGGNYHRASTVPRGIGVVEYLCECYSTNLWQWHCVSSYRNVLR